MPADATPDVKALVISTYQVTSGQKPVPSTTVAPRVTTTGSKPEKPSNEEQQRAAMSRDPAVKATVAALGLAKP